MKGLNLTKRSSTFVKYYFPCEGPEGGGSSYNKWKLLAVCLINKTDKLLSFSLFLLVGSQAFWQSTADNVAFNNSIGSVLGF